MSRYTRLVILLLVLWVGVSPRDAGATSVYSMNLVGGRVEAGDVRAVSLGGMYQLVVDSLAVLQANPALLARLAQVTIGVSQVLASDEGRNAEGAERDVSFRFPSLRLAFPIVDLAVISVGFRGRYDPDGGFSVRGETESGEGFTQSFEKSGGLFSIPLGLSFDVTRFLSVGLTISREGGSVEDRWNTIYDDPSAVEGAVFEKEEFSGTGYGASAVAYPFGRFIIGGSYESAIDYDTDIERFREFSQPGAERPSSTQRDTVFTSTARLPARISIGATWGVSHSILVAGSYTRSDFTDFEGLGFPKERLDVEEVYSFGIEYADAIPLKKTRLPLRLSFMLEKLPYQHPEGHDVSKFLIGLGTGIAFRSGRGKLDIGIQGGKTGTIDENLVEDRLFRIYVGVSGGEVWKRKGPER